MAKHKFFITGTDTDVGKTLIAVGLLEAANKMGLSTLGLKPVADGCEQTDAGLRNADALLLQQTMSVKLSYEQINPVALEPAIAPHIAAEQVGRRLLVSQLSGYCRGALMQPADFAVIEGAGGWRLPLNSVETLAGLAKELKLPVILVVGIKLGCINHALLTAEAIASDGLPLAGWVANQLQADMPCYQQNLTTLKSLIPAPCLGEIPFLHNPDAVKVSEYLNLGKMPGFGTA
jgi:dethiobiotin synthetase